MLGVSTSHQPKYVKTYCATSDFNQFVAFLVNQKFTSDALETLST